MPGLLGSRALLIADLTLIGQWVLGAIAVSGWIPPAERGFPPTAAGWRG